MVWLTAQRKDEGAVLEHSLLRIRTRHQHVFHPQDAGPDRARRSRGLEGWAVDAVLRYVSLVAAVCGTPASLAGKRLWCVKISFEAGECGICAASVLLRRSCERHGHSPWLLQRAGRTVSGHKHVGYGRDRARLAPLAARTPRLPERHGNLSSAPSPHCLRLQEPQDRILPGSFYFSFFLLNCEYADEDKLKWLGEQATWSRQ